MYKLFLTLRYLTRKKIVIFPILVVWLCVMMMIIVTSIMGGFVEHVQQANRDLLGDIIISNHDLAGWARYDELQADLKQQFPEIVASTPTIETFGLLTAGGGKLTEGVQIVGIDPVARSKVAQFRHTLFEQYISPTNAVEDLSPYLPATGAKLLEAANRRKDEADRRALDAQEAYSAVEDKVLNSSAPPTAAPFLWALWGLAPVGLLIVFILRKRRTGWRYVGAGVVLVVGLSLVAVLTAWPILFPTSLENAKDRAEQAAMESTRADRTALYAGTLQQNFTYSTAAELTHALVPPEPSFNVPPDPLLPIGTQPARAPATSANDDENAPPQGCIIGSYVLFGNRNARGNFDRSPYPEHYPIKLTIVPIGSGATVRTSHVTPAPFTVIDDSYSGVYDVDQSYVYAPFETIQTLTEMRNSVLKEGDPGWTPPRCNEVLIKLKDGISDLQMKEIALRMQAAVNKFLGQHPDSAAELTVQTWDQKQAKYLRAVENEKNMMTFILGLMSLVVIVVIFLIFYMIVRDKTRDIGIIKAVGGAEEGVAGIFVTYGAFIGIVGGLLGVISGVEFVLHTNQIHEWIFHMTGVIIWDRSVYVFDKIPDTVNPHEVALYFVAAVIAGVLGAAIPAIVAASQDPVKAVRYE
jgi:ABC-type lipoprotein release transport system permease subunit